MTDIEKQAVSSLQVQIAELEKQLESLLCESSIMDDEVHAIGRDLEALRRALAVGH